MIKLLAKIALWILLLILVIASTFIWFESTKEVRVLCHFFRPHQIESSVIRTLDTGNFLRYRIDQGAVTDSAIIEVTTPYNLGASQCRIVLSDEATVRSIQYTQSIYPERIAAWFGSIGFAGMAVFQLLLAMGWPLGHLAWGGKYQRLPIRLRWASGFVVLIYVFGIIVLMEGAKIVSVLGMRDVISYSLGVLFLGFGGFAIANFKSENALKRKVMIPSLTILCYCCLIVGISYW